MFHPFRCPNCNGVIKNHTWFCPFCETNLKKEYAKKQQPHCFIATAAYGTPWHSDIDVLRRYRDNVLAKRTLGRLFIHVYYTISPPIARIISKNIVLKKSTQKMIKMLLPRLK